MLRLPETVRKSLSVNVSANGLRIPIVNGATVPIGSGESWKSDVLHRLLRVRDGVFVDCGVNLGQTLLEIRSLTDRGYVGFEPNPECAHYAQRLIDANGWRDTTLVAVGLSDEPGVGVLHARNATSPGATLLPDARPLNRGLPTHTVPLLPFDVAWGAIDRPIAVVKIDVEGYEAHALRGMRQALARYRPPILCEVLPGARGTDLSDAARRHEEIVDVLAELDYTILRPVRSSNDSPISGIEELDGFLREHFDVRRMYLYDYLLAPQEDVPDISALFDSESELAHA